MTGGNKELQMQVIIKDTKEIHLEDIEKAFSFTTDLLNTFEGFTKHTLHLFRTKLENYLISSLMFV